MRKYRNILLTIIIIASSITAYGATYTLTSASYPVNLNGQKLAVEPLNYNGTTYLPLRSISEAVGVPIAWDSTKKSVEISTVDVERLKEACVMIFAANTTQGSQGSAVCWEYGQYLTAYHVVDNGQTNIKTSRGKALTVDTVSEKLDIATLNSMDSVKPVKIGDSDEVQVGDRVIIIASPKEKEDMVAYGTVSNPDARGMVVLTDGLSNSTGGSSGGAVFDLRGCLIGVLVAEDLDNMGRFLIIPINDIRKAL